jgi:membrane protein DedA with SNARE-associated domain
MTEEATEAPAPRRLPLALLLTPYVALIVAGYVGDIFGPNLINSHPLLQMFLNPRNRYLLLASPNVDVVPFFVVGFFRLVLTDPIGFVIGWQYGDAAIAWAERQTGAESSGTIKTIQRWFNKAAHLVIFIAPSFFWCILAGAARMRVRVFVALNVTGTVARLVLFRVAGDAFRDELETVLEWIQRYQLPLIGLSAVLVLVQVWRSGGRDLETPSELAAELEGEGEEHDHG